MVLFKVYMLDEETKASMDKALHLSRIAWCTKKFQAISNDPPSPLILAMSEASCTQSQEATSSNALKPEWSYIKKQI